MGKQSDAKEAQGYVPKATPQTCGNCSMFLFDRVQTQPSSIFNKDGWWEDKNMRCGRGGFAVKKMATCRYFAAKE